MKKINLIIAAVLATGMVSCADQLDVTNPNNQTTSTIALQQTTTFTCTVTNPQGNCTGSTQVTVSIEGSDMNNGAVAVRGYVPLSQMFGYATDLRSRTQGRGVYVMQFDHYGETPRYVQDEILKKVGTIAR